MRLYAIILIVIGGLSPFQALAQSSSEGSLSTGASNLLSEPNRYRFVLSAGLESRLEKEINPRFYKPRQLGLLNLQFRFPKRFTISLEAGEEKREASSGALNIETQVYDVSLWGRYALRDHERWAPYASLGAGAYFDEVESSFLEESSNDSGLRRMGGLGAGISATFYSHLSAEAELRGELIEDRVEIVPSGLVRLGVIY